MIFCLERVAASRAFWSCVMGSLFGNARQRGREGNREEKREEKEVETPALYITTTHARGSWGNLCFIFLFGNVVLGEEEYDWAFFVLALQGELSGA